MRLVPSYSLLAGVSPLHNLVTPRNLFRGVFLLALHSGLVQPVARLRAFVRRK